MPDSALNTFAAELKAWRERMGLTQQAFADKLGYSLALVAAVEQCKRSPTPEFAARCDEVTGAPGTFTRWQVQVSRESYPAFFAPVLAFERDAVLHGVLQRGQDRGGARGGGRADDGDQHAPGLGAAASRVPRACPPDTESDQ